VKLIICTMQRHTPNPNSCGNSGGLEIALTLERELTDAGLLVPVERVACLGKCLTAPLKGGQGAVVQLYPTGKSWRGVTCCEAAEIVAYVKQQSAKR